MHWADINAALTKAGWGPYKTSKHLKVDPTAISKVTRGQCSSYRIAKFISAKTGLSLDTLWPDGRYTHSRRTRRRTAA